MHYVTNLRANATRAATPDLDTLFVIILKQSSPGNIKLIALFPPAVRSRDTQETCRKEILCSRQLYRLTVNSTPTKRGQ